MYLKNLVTNIFLVSIFSVLTGCASLTRLPPEIIEKIVTVEVKIPIVQPCVTEDIPLPVLIIGTLTNEDINDPGKVVQFYVADVTLLKSVVMRQKKLLDACKVSSNTPEPEPIVKPLASKPAIEGTSLGPEPVEEPNPEVKPNKPVKPNPVKLFDPPPPAR